MPRFYTAPKKRIRILSGKIEKLKKRIATMEETKKTKKVLARYKKSIRLMSAELTIAKKYYGKYSDRFGFLDFTYNLGIVKYFRTKYPKARKPINVVHFHPEYPRCIDFFYLGKNQYNVRIVTDQLEELLLKYNFIKPENKRSVLKKGNKE